MRKTENDNPIVIPYASAGNIQMSIDWPLLALSPRPLREYGPRLNLGVVSTADGQFAPMREAFARHGVSVAEPVVFPKGGIQPLAENYKHARREFEKRMRASGSRAVIVGSSLGGLVGIRQLVDNPDDERLLGVIAGDSPIGEVAERKLTVVRKILSIATLMPGLDIDPAGCFDSFNAFNRETRERVAQNQDVRERIHLIGTAMPDLSLDIPGANLHHLGPAPHSSLGETGGHYPTDRVVSHVNAVRHPIALDIIVRSSCELTVAQEQLHTSKV